MADWIESIWNLPLQQLKTYLHYHNAYGHQIWQGGDLAWGAPTHKVTRTFYHAIFRNHVANENHFLSTTRVPVATKLGRMVTHLDGLLTIKSHDPLIIYLHQHSVMANKLGGMETYLEVLLTINHFDKQKRSYLY